MGTGMSLPDSCFGPGLSPTSLPGSSSPFKVIETSPPGSSYG